MRRFAAADHLCRVNAADQYSLINLTQALRSGQSRDAIQNKLDTGQWNRVLAEVYQLAGSRMDGRTWMMAAYLWGGERSAISYTTAANLLGLDGFGGGGPIHLTIDRKRHSPSSRLRLHSTRDLSELEITLIGPIGVTSVRKTLLDLAAIGHRRLEAALDQCRREGLTNIEQLWLLLDRPSSIGRRGVKRLRDLVVARSPELAPTDSDLEDLFLRVVRMGDFPQPVSQHPIRLAGRMIRADFAYPEIKLAIECDSYTWHMDREAFERDRIRDAELQGLGWIVFRVTWAQLRYDPESVIGALRKILTVRLQLGA